MQKRKKWCKSERRGTRGIGRDATYSVHFGAKKKKKPKMEKMLARNGGAGAKKRKRTKMEKMLARNEGGLVAPKKGKN